MTSSACFWDTRRARVFIRARFFFYSPHLIHSSCILDKNRRYNGVFHKLFTSYPQVIHKMAMDFVIQFATGMG